MTTALQTPAGRAPMKGLAVRDGSGLHVSPSAVIRGSDGALITWWGNLTVTLDKTQAYGIAYRSSSGVITSEVVTATVNDGTPPFTYAWTLVEDDGTTSWFATAPTSAATSFKASVIPFGTSNATFALNVSDRDGNTSPSVNVFVVLTSEGSY